MMQNIIREREKPVSSFKEKKGDPGFLVAKGRFSSPQEGELQDLIRSGIKTDDPRIFELKKQIDVTRRELEKRHVKDLASAIYMAVSNHGYATIRCIGRNAFYNAGKAIGIATGYCAAKGVILRFGLTFDEGNLGAIRLDHHVKNVTAMLFTLEGFKTSEVRDDSGEHDGTK